MICLLGEEHDQMQEAIIDGRQKNLLIYKAKHKKKLGLKGKKQLNVCHEILNGLDSTQCTCIRWHFT